MKNQLFAPIGALLLWSTQLAFAIEAWRASSGRAIADWLAAVGDFEALCALAAYSYENPGDPFPELEADGPLFVAEGVGHPLIAPGRCVRNDLSLGGPLRVLVVSGSNMSGKSTLLRTVGINTVLALAGAPVRADRLRISPMAIGATLRIQDSLQAGRSRFFAEITRLRQLVDLAKGPLPLLFLLDEILNGTNSHDRRVGAESLLARADRPRGDRPGHDARPGPGRDRRSDRGGRRERPLRGPLRGRDDALRPPDAARRRPPQQRAGADAGRRARRLSSTRRVDASVAPRSPADSAARRPRSRLASSVGMSPSQRAWIASRNAKAARIRVEKRTFTAMYIQS